ncbi:hypothetical protein ACVBEF_11785 [Glaciimonas sp. GG7]
MLSTASLPVRVAHRPQIHSLVLVFVFLANRVQPVSPLGLQARPEANGARVMPLI